MKSVAIQRETSTMKLSQSCKRRPNYIPDLSIRMIESIARLKIRQILVTQEDQFQIWNSLCAKRTYQISSRSRASSHNLLTWSEKGSTILQWRKRKVIRSMGIGLIIIITIALLSSLLNTIVKVNRVCSSIQRHYASRERKFLCGTNYSLTFNPMSLLKKSKIVTW